MLREIIDHHGVPLALYSDRHGIFHRSTNEPETIAEQLRGRRDPTQFGRALQELDIRLIMAHTPQAKGRIERAWGTFQDRLVSELRLAGASTIEQANKVLWDFIPRYNERFAVAPAQPGSAYRPLPAGVSLDETLCFKYLRTVANDNTVQFDSAAIQLLSDDHRASYARATVEVQERLDGSIVVTYHGRTLAAKPAPPEPVTLRARSTRRSNGHLPAETPVADSTGALIHPVGDERRNGARSLQETPPRNPPKTKPRHPSRPAPNHPWR